MPPPVPVILNAGSGHGHADDDVAKLTQYFRDAGIEPRILLAHEGHELCDFAREAMKEKPPLIVAGGGDGTMNAVASVLVGSQTALGVLPLGTLNHFAKDLGIPPELDAAVKVAVAGKRKAVDVGEVNGRIFLNNSSLGIYPSMVVDREKRRRRFGLSKWHAMFWAMLTVLQRHPFLSLRLNVDGHEVDRRTPFVFIGNNAYAMEGFTLGMRERLDGGVLSLNLARRRGRFGLLTLALRALVGMLEQADDFEATTAAELRIESRHKRLLVATDGEVAALELPFDYRVRPGALQVMVP